MAIKKIKPKSENKKTKSSPKKKSSNSGLIIVGLVSAVSLVCAMACIGIFFLSGGKLIMSPEDSATRAAERTANAPTATVTKEIKPTATPVTFGGNGDDRFGLTFHRSVAKVVTIKYFGTGEFVMTIYNSQGKELEPVIECNVECELIQNFTFYEGKYNIDVKADGVWNIYFE